MQRHDETMRRLVASQAAEWHVACSEGDLAPQQARALMAWLRTSPLHVAEFLQVASIAGEIADAARRDPTPIGTLGADAGDGVPLLPSSYPRPARSSSHAAGRHLRRQRFLRLVLPGAAATLVLAVAAPLVWFGLQHPTPSPSVQIFSTGRGQQRTFTLPDHTGIELDSDSAITVRFNARERHVVVDRGQVFFKVARDPARPFSVRVEHSLVRDIGTAFDVYRHRAGSSITVAEGRIQVWTVAERRQPTTEWSRWFRGRGKQGGTLVASLGAGRRVQLTAGGQVVSLGDADIQRALAWRDGQIAFDNESIESVVARFNRYNQTQIRVANRHVGRLLITGVFNARDVATFTAFLGSLPGVKVSRNGQTITVIAGGKSTHHRQ